MSIDALIDAFVARLAPEALKKLPLWIRPIAAKILDAFYAINFDAELKRLIDEWLKGDQSEPLVMFAMKRLPADRGVRVERPIGNTGAKGVEFVDPFTILSLVALALRIFGFLKTEPLMGSSEESPEFVVAYQVTSDDEELTRAFESALAA